jgi:hypothetical protein
MTIKRTFSADGRTRLSDYYIGAMRGVAPNPDCHHMMSYIPGRSDPDFPYEYRTDVALIVLYGRDCHSLTVWNNKMHYPQTLTSAISTTSVRAASHRTFVIIQTTRKSSTITVLRMGIIFLIASGVPGALPSSNIESRYL